MSWLRNLGLTIAIGAASLVPSRASAFCRTITAPIPADFDQTSGCYPAVGAIPLWWGNACVGFSVQQNASSQIALTDARTHAQTAFNLWSNAGCSGGGSPSIKAEDEGPVACSKIGYSQIGPNQHVIIFRDKVWPYSDPYNTLALTTVTFDTDTGEIYDADMEVNTAQTTIVVNKTPGVNEYDFDSIITHEAGHFLGMAHSPLQAAVMYAHYKPGSAALTSDDIAGICATYTPAGTRATDQDSGTSIVPIAVQQASCDPTPRHGFGSACGPPGIPATVRSTSGCTVSATPGSAAAGSGLAALAGACALALALARRRRARPLRDARLPDMKGLRGVMLGLLVCGVVASGPLAAEREARASVSIQVLFDELVRESSAVAIVTPVEQRAVWEDGRIITYTRVHADRAVAGKVESDAWVRTMGGTVGKIGQLVDGEPVLTVGRPGLLFLKPVAEEGAGVYEVTARAQGQFPVVFDEQKASRFRASSAVGGLVPTPQQRIADVSQLRARTGLAPGAPLATEVLHKRAVEDGVRDVAAAWVRIHGSK